MSINRGNFMDNLKWTIEGMENTTTKKQLRKEITKLANYFMKEESDEIKEGSAVDNAIRLLKERKKIK